VIVEIPAETGLTAVLLTVATAVLLEVKEGVPKRVLPSVSVTVTVANRPV
jgi:hypothetical protein